MDFPSSAVRVKSGALSPIFSISDPFIDVRRARRAAPLRLRQEFADDVVDGLRIALAFGGAHDLAYEEFEDAFVAGAEFGDVVGIFGDDFAGGGFDGAGVADLGEAFGGDNFRGAAAGVEHRGENFFADGAADLAGFDEF